MVQRTMCFVRCTQEGDPVDLRGVLHRDGSVLAAVALADLARPDALYRKLGCKLAVGMPFKVCSVSALHYYHLSHVHILQEVCIIIVG
jgi:hypothetical protein